MKALLLAFVALTVSGCAEAATYSQVESLSGNSFIDAFTFQTIADPTNGRVNYVSQSTAQADGLYWISGTTVTLRADDTSILDPNGPGRNSFNLKSNNQYSTHVAIFDIGHLPQGCGTWPAEVGNSWPNDGEIDILEGVDDHVPNQSTLHTSAGCTMPSPRGMTGWSLGDDCDVYTTGNSGCSVAFSDSNSFGPNFNNVGGGWYAIERSSTYISIFFWERNNPSVPSEVMYPGSTVDTSTWGTPAAYFPNTYCDFPSHFGPMNIVIDLTFCGDWAGAVYGADGCPGNCVDYVNNNPGAFAYAYFEFNSLNIYE